MVRPARRIGQLEARLHQGEAEKIEAAPLGRVFGAVVVRGQADAPDSGRPAVDSPSCVAGWGVWMQEWWELSGS